MANLRDLKVRIGSVKSTRKITSAMKMVAASKLKKAQDQAEASQPYAMSMSRMLGRVAQSVMARKSGSPLLMGTGRDKVHLLLVVTSDRGLCGGFNSNLLRRVRQEIRQIEAMGKQVKIICVGRKGYDSLRRDLKSYIVDSFINIASGGKRLSFSIADDIATKVLNMFEDGEFDICSVLYNEFQSVLVQKPSNLQLIPFQFNGDVEANDNDDQDAKSSKAAPQSPYEFEPDEEEILNKLLPKNLGIQIFRSLLDSAAGEQAARMTAMDNATRNAGDMISDLTLQYNRERQAAITNELIEIISGAEAI